MKKLREIFKRTLFTTQPRTTVSQYIGGGFFGFFFSFCFLLVFFVGDCFTAGTQVINSMKFTTKDQDNDMDASKNCAILYPSGWWHRACHCSNPNGLYLAGDTKIFGKGITYKPWLTHYYSLKTILLMVRKVGSKKWL